MVVCWRCVMPTTSRRSCLDTRVRHSSGKRNRTRSLFSLNRDLENWMDLNAVGGQPVLMVVKIEEGYTRDLYNSRGHYGLRGGGVGRWA